MAFLTSVLWQMHSRAPHLSYCQQGSYRKYQEETSSWRYYQGCFSSEKINWINCNNGIELESLLLDIVRQYFDSANWPVHCWGECRLTVAITSELAQLLWAGHIPGFERFYRHSQEMVGF